jgi:tetratricopeptide (TPR) repeat protein
MSKYVTPSQSPAQRSSNDQALARAELALRMGNFAEAERLAAGALKADRASGAAASLLGRALMGQGRAADAIAPLKKAARRGNDPAVETLLGGAYAAIGREQDAVAQLREAAARQPPFLPAFRELAGLLAKTGQHDEAIAVLERGLALTAETTGLQLDLQLDLARLYLARNARTRARAMLLKARAAAPGRPDILAMLARVLLLDGEYASAAEAYRQVLAQHPDDATTQINLAASLLELDEREAAEQNLRAAMRGRPQMLGRAIHSLAAASHGRFFLRVSSVAKFLHGETA